MVQKCDEIRKFMKSARLPNNRNWTYGLDQLFFRPSPPRTPTLLQNSEDSMTAVTQSSSHNNYSSGAWNQYHVDRPPELLPDLSAGREQLVPDLPLNEDQPSDLPVLPVSQERLPALSRQVEEVQLSDLTATRGPITDSQVSFQQHAEEEHAMPATPLSAVCGPDLSQAAGDSAPRQEILWPLNRVMRCNIMPNVYSVMMLNGFTVYVIFCRTVVFSPTLHFAQHHDDGLNRACMKNTLSCIDPLCIEKLLLL